MHARIYQISKNPITEDDYITEDRYYDWFVGSVADYVDGQTNRQGDLENLKENMERLGIAKFSSDLSFMTIVDKSKYFDVKYIRWKELLSQLLATPFEVFCGGEGVNSLSMAEYGLREVYDDKYGIYMDDNGEYYGNQTLDEFMRNTNDGDIWYFGATIDYHM